MGISVLPAASATASYSPTGTPAVVDEFTSLTNLAPGVVTRNVTIPAGALKLSCSVPAVFNINGKSAVVFPNQPKAFYNPSSVASYTINLVMQTAGFNWRIPAVTVGGYAMATYAAWTNFSNSNSYQHGSIAFGAGLFHINRDDGTSFTSSNNGETWTRGSAPTTNHHLGSFSGTLFYARDGIFPANTAYSSTDATTWTARTFTATGLWNRPLKTTGTNYVTWSAGTSATVDSNLSNISANGTTWTAGGSMPSNAGWFSGDVDTATGRVMVAAASNTNLSALVTTTKACTSTNNGATWTALTLPTAQTWRALHYLNGTWIALSAGTIYATSTNDGTTWTTRTLPFLGDGDTRISSIYSFIASNGVTNAMYLTGASTNVGSNGYSMTTDGINFTSLPTNRLANTDGLSIVAGTLENLDNEVVFNRGSASNGTISVTCFSTIANFSAVSNFIPASIGIYAGSTTTI